MFRSLYEYHKRKTPYPSDEISNFQADFVGDGGESAYAERGVYYGKTSASSLRVLHHSFFVVWAPLVFFFGETRLGNESQGVYCRVLMR